MAASASASRPSWPRTRKSFFVPMDDASGFTRGEKELTAAFVDGIKVALLICADFNEPSSRPR